ncbi:MarR family winged helix-turn-helix transcriptional regulator [Ferruginivarius sediminum]|jgi:DNA-binding MarR family transcriptional regulator|uniref:MarR family transcriptional regulator n=1 Tax=Ferruginivarius sediminum TaxID=2661937 RepID=A0A369T8A4_9PROT|nr:MarR family transcriptional regulator [Ferruginivarius sediminum]RDD61508.1 MarR family transcriptional regulator [Ferruginivarius sediminum]
MAVDALKAANGGGDTAKSPEEIAAGLEQLVRLQFSQSFRNGLKPAQWHALRYFANAAEEDRTVTAFARHRASTMGTASTTISTLVRKGYLARDYGQGVPRNRGLHLTEAGQRLLDEDPVQTLVDAIRRLDAQEQGLLAGTIEKLVASLADARTATTQSVG